MAADRTDEGSLSRLDGQPTSDSGLDDAGLASGDASAALPVGGSPGSGDDAGAGAAAAASTTHASYTKDMRLENLAFEFDKFCAHMAMLGGPGDGFTNEYMHLALLERNEPRALVQISKSTMFKNRYLDIIPVESTMVSLGSPEEARTAASYINANFVSLWTDMRYIASQGPLPNTLVDFWRMVWMQNVHLIVMLTNLVERGLEKCHLYWPEFEQTQEIGPFRIHYTARSRRDDYTIRTMALTHIESGASRLVTQAHFTSWPDQGVPLPEPFAEFCDVVDATISSSPPAPIVVHCSAGVGRTGVFIACKEILEHMRVYLAEGTLRMLFLFDVKNTVRKMRTMRPFMVQNRDQYVFVYSYIRSQVARFLDAQRAARAPAPLAAAAVEAPVSDSATSAL